MGESQLVPLKHSAEGWDTGLRFELRLTTPESRVYNEYGVQLGISGSKAPGEPWGGRPCREVIDYMCSRDRTPPVRSACSSVDGLMFCR